ncbi:MAG: D-2-hydroxyacid dehydrogenase [Chloroflexi bacterium]|nr:D-2-hydroxyacid dehydrogenase [Chloroflexota bacterium]
MPPGVWGVVGEETKERLINSHPAVIIETASDPERFAAELPLADGVLVFSFSIPDELLNPGSRLRWVHSIRAGSEQLLTPALVAAEHVAITASKGPHAPLIAEHMVLLMLSLARHMPALIKDQEEHNWRSAGQGDGNPLSIQMLGKTITILGVGQIGENLARMCKIGFGMKVLGMSRTTRGSAHVDRYFDRSALHEALGEADVVALCLALTPSTNAILGKAEFAAMKPTGFLINGARGGLIDEDALIDAMTRGTIAGAGLDTVGEEPLPENSPLWDLPNTIITSHVAAYTDGMGNEVGGFMIENIRRFAENEPLLGIVHRHEGY